MPIIWRYLLGNYLKVLCLCTFTFIALLLTLRLTEIAHFATLGAEGGYIAYFALCQIPYILPIALPISALISAIILAQQLSKNRELTALRSGGLSLWSIFAPVLFAAAFLSVANFYVASEMATNSHLATALIKSELRSINPLHVLGNKHFMKVSGIYFDTLGPSKVGKSASDILLAMPSKDGDHIDLVISKNLRTSSEDFTSKHLTLLSEISRSSESDEKHFFIENIAKTTTSIQDFAQMVQKKSCTLNSDHLQMPFLLSRLDEEKHKFWRAQSREEAESVLKCHQRSITRIYTEMMRRFSVALAVFTFTFLGVSCGITIGRNSSSRGLATVVALGALYIAAYFSAKGIDHLLVGSMLFYFLPHVLLVAVAMWQLRRATKGIEL